MAQKTKALRIPDTTNLDETETFDLDSWIAGANPISREILVYQRMDLYSEIDRLRQALRFARSTTSGLRSIGDPAPAAIKTQLQQVAEQIAASAVTIRLHGLTNDRQVQIGRRIKAAHPRWGQNKLGLATSYAVLCEAIETITAADGRTVDGFTDPDQVKRFAEKVGDAQWTLVVKAFNEASLTGVDLPTPFSLDAFDDPPEDEE